MDKIGLVTIIGYQNYGNRLQNYAAQEVLEGLGFEVITILNIQKEPLIKKNNLADRFKNINKKVILNKIKNFFNKAKKNKEIQNKISKFKKFSEQYIHESDFEISEGLIPNTLDDNFEYFVVGSDQVWNPFYRSGSEIDFLTFASKEKKIAYAASFGISEIPNEYKENYKKWLEDFNYISVRENDGAKIIKELTNLDVPVLVDPTLMLDAEDWLKISKTPLNKPQTAYILTYVLGEKTNELKKFINKISDEKKMEVVNIADYNDLQYYDIDPSEFIDLINSSSLIITDSFHGTVFSILFNKPFIVYERVDYDVKMNSRINTLLSKFSLENRTWNTIDKSNVFNVDFSDIPRRLEIERNITLEYLWESLKIK